MKAKSELDRNVEMLAEMTSSTGKVVKLHEMGAGLLADSPDEWAEHVARLLASPEERAELAARGRAVMAGLTFLPRLAAPPIGWVNMEAVLNLGTMTPRITIGLVKLAIMSGLFLAIHMMY